MVVLVLVVLVMMMVVEEKWMLDREKGGRLLAKDRRTKLECKRTECSLIHAWAVHRGNNSPMFATSHPPFPQQPGDSCATKTHHNLPALLGPGKTESKKERAS